MRAERREAGGDLLLRVRGVRRGAGGPSWSFDVRRGGAVWIADGRDSQMRWLDWLSGIEVPPAGEVLWRGVEWREYAVGAAAAERGSIGWIFDENGLVMNLDMDENAWLPSRMHRRGVTESAMREWAAFFECDPLPETRAAAVSEQMQLRVQWVRAFASAPELLVLEQPYRDTSAEDRRLLMEAVSRARARGAGVVWLSEKMKAETRQALEPLADAVPDVGEVRG